jgi:hypothetical protein
MKDSKLVDRQLVNSLLVAYVSKPEQRHEVLTIMSKILDWDEETKQQVRFLKTSLGGAFFVQQYYLTAWWASVVPCRCKECMALKV